MAARVREEVDSLDLPRTSCRRCASPGAPDKRADGLPFSLALAPRARRLVTPEELFVALDGRSLTADTDRFDIEVFSVRDEAGRRWVQLALAGEHTRRLLTVRLEPGDTAQHVFMTLTPGSRPLEHVDVSTSREPRQAEDRTHAPSQETKSLPEG